MVEVAVLGGFAVVSMVVTFLVASRPVGVTADGRRS